MPHVIPMSESESPKKRKKPTRLSDRSRLLLLEEGYQVAFVERSYQIEKKVGGKPTGETYWVKVDAFGIADMIAVKPDVPGTLYLQTTDHTSAARHKNTMLGESATRAILQSGNRIQLHVWKKRTVQKVERWTVQVLDLQIGDRQELYFRDMGSENDIDVSTQNSPSLFPELPNEDF